MAPTRQVLIGVIVTAILFLLGWAFYLNIEFYEETVDTPWSSRALRDPYLAARQFLERSGIAVVEAESLVDLENLQGAGTLFIGQSNRVVNPRQLESVIEWLESGGSLILTATSTSDEDLLLRRFGVEVEKREGDLEDDPQSISESLREYNEKLDRGMTPGEIAAQVSEDEFLTLIQFNGDIGNLEVAFDHRRILVHPYIEEGEDADANLPRPFSWSSSVAGVHLMQFEVGDGLLTIVSDPGLWRSTGIARHDHAYLLWILSSNAGHFALLRRTERQALWDALTENAYDALLAATLFLVFWLWRKGQRFGRILPSHESPRRSLGQHFSATANYLWHRGAGESLLKPLRGHIYRSATLTLPGYAGADNAKQVRLIAEHCNLDAASVAEAMQRDTFNESGFIRAVKLLKTIEHSLWTRPR